MIRKKKDPLKRKNYVDLVPLGNNRNIGGTMTDERSENLGSGESLSPARKKFLFSLLYMSEGAPIGFIWWTLPTRLRAEGVPIETITSITAVLILPWVFKFLWAPVVDVVRSPRWTLKSWILSSQTLMGLTLLPLAFLEFRESMDIILVLLFMHALSGATQDAAIDALAISFVRPHERGSLNGWMQFGMLAGKSVFGGSTLVLNEIVGDRIVVVSLVGVIWFSGLIVLVTLREDNGGERDFRRDFSAFFGRLRDAARGRTLWMGLMFAGLGGTAFEAVGSVAGPFLIDNEFLQEEVGMFFAVPAVVGMMVGSLLGGYAADRIGKRRSTTLFLFAICLTVYFLAILDGTGLFGKEGLIAVLSLLYVCIGLFTASSYALFMDITNVRLGATQFSAYMGATNLCESWSSFANGRIIAEAGYAIAFVVMSTASLVSLAILKGLRLPEAGRPGS
jgi:PAT family beta-lactamase induction signal transducer AmpG